TMQTWVVQERWGQHGAQSAANLSAQLRQFNQLQLLGQLQLVPRQEGSAAHQVVHDALEYLSYDPAAVASAFSIFAAETNPNRSEVLPVSANSTSDGSMNLNSSLAASRAVPAAESSAAPEGASDADRAMLGAATGGLAFALWDLEETAAVVMGVQVLLTQLRQLARSSDAEKIFNSDEQRIAELADSGGYQAPDAVMWVLSQLPRLALSDVSRLRGMLQHHHQKTGASVVRGLLHAILEWEVERLQGRSSEAGSLEAEIRATTHVDPEELEGAAHDLERELEGARDLRDCRRLARRHCERPRTIQLLQALRNVYGKEVEREAQRSAERELKLDLRISAVNSLLNISENATSDILQTRQRRRRATSLAAYVPEWLANSDAHLQGDAIIDSLLLTEDWRSVRHMFARRLRSSVIPRRLTILGMQGASCIALTLCVCMP
ncbi:hypothetical protein CYMTET_30728, partial [Cymbomonas tetramitiformis]